MKRHWLQSALLGILTVLSPLGGFSRNVLQTDASIEHPPNTCALPEWLSEFAGPSPKDRISFITEARLNDTAAAEPLIVLNGNVGDDSPLVLFDCRKAKALVFLPIPK